VISTSFCSQPNSLFVDTFNSIFSGFSGKCSCCWVVLRGKVSNIHQIKYLHMKEFRGSSRDGRSFVYLLCFNKNISFFIDNWISLIARAMARPGFFRLKVGFISGGKRLENIPLLIVTMWYKIRQKINICCTTFDCRRPKKFCYSPLKIASTCGFFKTISCVCKFYNEQRFPFMINIFIELLSAFD